MDTRMDIKDYVVWTPSVIYLFKVRQLKWSTRVSRLLFEGLYDAVGSDVRNTSIVISGCAYGTMKWKGACHKDHIY